MAKYIRKASGQKEAFNRPKLKHSLERAGVEANTARRVSLAVEQTLPRGATTDDVLKNTIRLLKKENAILASRYDLKKAIMNLGPTGFPFEDFVAAILRAYGFQTKVGQIVRGFCVNHEVDVVAKKGNRHIMVECKYHNERGVTSDVKVSMYTYARFKDIEQCWQDAEHARRGREAHFHEAWLVTNTHCTKDARVFAECNKLRIVSWHYPERASLEDFIERKGLYPVTMLPSITRRARDLFFKAGITIAREVATGASESIAKATGLPRDFVLKLQAEARELCSLYLAYGDDGTHNDI